MNCEAVGMQFSLIVVSINQLLSYKSLPMGWSSISTKYEG
jgi:hypothetical protein